MPDSIPKDKEVVVGDGNSSESSTQTTAGGGSGGNATAPNDGREVAPAGGATENSSEGSRKNTPETGAYLVCKGAICKCALGAAPAQLKITSHSKFFVNDSSGKDKLVATVKDVEFEPPAFGTCAAKNNQKCEPVAVEWQLLAGDEIV